MKLCVIFIFLSFAINLNSQETVNQFFLQHIKKAPYHVTINVNSLVNYLIIPAKTDKDKLELFFLWIAENISYDTESYTAGNYQPSDAQVTLNNRKAVCQGYSELYKTMCDIVGIKCKVINGYAKGYAYKPGDTFKNTNHAWNAVFLDKWYLLDVTWGSGYVEVKDGVLQFGKKLKMENFVVSPQIFVKRHLSALPMWQLLEHPITMESYLKSTKEEVIINSDTKYFNYNDSIALYESLNEEERKVKEAESKFRFYPIDQEYLAMTYYNYAVFVSTNNKDTESLQKALKYYIKAKKLYFSTQNDNAVKMIEYCDHGIEYVKFYLNR